MKCEENSCYRAGYCGVNVLDLYSHMLSSNLGYPDCEDFSDLSSPPDKFRDNVSIRPQSLSCKSFPIRYPPVITLPSDAKQSEVPTAS